MLLVSDCWHLPRQRTLDTRRFPESKKAIISAQKKKELSRQTTIISHVYTFNEL
jgi:hypothetical protein